MMVSVKMVRMLAGALEHRRVDRARFLKCAELDERTIEDGDARIPLVRYLRAIDVALELSKDPALGLHLGEQANPTMFDVVGYLAEYGPTLRQSLETTARYSRLMAEGHDPQLVEAGELAAVRFPSLCGDHVAVRLTAEFALVALLAMLRRFVGPHEEPNHVRFAYDEPDYAAEYRRLLGDRLQFGRSVTELEFPRAWLDKRHLYASPELHAMFETRAESMLHRLERQMTLADRVSSILAAYEPQQMPTMTQVARSLQMSSRTMRRKLAAEQTTYAELVERTLVKAAKRMLETPGASIQETAYAMGFAAPAAFHRAFKRWTGLTPKQYQSSF